MSSTATDAVRQYLQFLADPSQLVDPARIAELEATVAATSDVLGKLKAVGDLHRAREIDGGVYAANFIRHAKDYVEAEGVPVQAFAEMGVPHEVLVGAGLVTKGRGRAAAVRLRPAAAASTAARAKAVPTGDITAWILKRKAIFTTADVGNGAGGSPATIKKAIDDLVKSGQLINRGADPAYSGRGRAPYRYEVKR